jgi:hypothetical protein
MGRSLDFDVVDAGGNVERDDDGTQRWTLQLDDGANSAEIDIWVTDDGGDCDAIVHSDSDRPS